METTPLLAWSLMAPAEPTPYPPSRWPTVIAACTTALAGLIIACAPILEHHPEPRYGQPIIQTPAAQMALPGQQQPALEPPHRAGVPYTEAPGSLNPFDALGHPPSRLVHEPDRTIHPHDLSELLGGHK